MASTVQVSSQKDVWSNSSISSGGGSGSSGIVTGTDIMTYANFYASCVASALSDYFLNGCRLFKLNMMSTRLFTECWPMIVFNQVNLPQKASFISYNVLSIATLYNISQFSLQKPLSNSKMLPKYL